MRIFIALLLIVFQFTSNAQVIKFNKLYSDTFPTMRNIVVLDTGYVILGGGGVPLAILTAFVDSNGNMKLKKKIRFAGYDYYHGAENSLVKLKGNGYALAASFDKQNSNENGGFLLKFNNKFDTLWMQKYFKDTINITILYGCSQTPDSGFALAGTKKTGTSYSDALLIKTNKEGVMQWSKKYGGVYPDNAYKVINMPNNGFLVGGVTRNYQNVFGQYAGDWYFVKTDSNGTNLWQNHYGNPSYNDGYVTSLKNLKDSGYIAGGLIATSIQLNRIHIIRFDKNVSIVWDKQYLTNASWTVLYSILELNNEDLITIGTKEVNATILGFIMRLTPHGDIIWKRNFNATGNIYSASHALAIATTPDNSFAFTGYAYDSGGPQQMWLVKTDSLGCDGVHSCDDTLMFLSAINLHDSVCFGDSVHITLNFGGRSAPYILQSSTDFVQDSIYYFDSGNDTISRTFTVLPQQENAYFNFTASVTDSWGATKTKDFSFYVKHCSTSVASNNADLLKFQVYPNPAKETITISCSENQNALVYLLNMQGEIIKQINMQNKIEINIRDFSQGIYFVKIVTEKGLLIKKIIKE